MLKYWDIIHWDATSFLTIHDRYASRIYHDKLRPNLARDLRYGARGLIGGVIRFLQGIVVSLRGRTPARRSFRHPYVLLITIGTAKYAGEEQEIVNACARTGLRVFVLHVSSRKGNLPDDGQLTLDSELTPVDYFWALSRWLWEVFRGLRACFWQDRKARSLFFASIYCIRHYFTNVAVARRILADYGMPLWALSLCPSAAMSRAIIGHVRDRGVVTAGIRTQTTSYALEHLGINSEILFCKSEHERQAYEQLFAFRGPRLQDGCLLSLPNAYELDPLSLPDEYVLLLGTGPSIGQDSRDYARFNEKLFRIAAAAGLPAVFKGHTLATDLDKAWFADNEPETRGCRQIADVCRNRELIDRSSLVVTAPSTLVYYAVLREKPVIVVEAEYNTRVTDEFQTAPFLRVRWGQEVALDRLDLSELRASGRAARRWFEETYFLDKASDYLVDVLLKKGGGAEGGSSHHKVTLR